MLFYWWFPFQPPPSQKKKKKRGTERLDPKNKTSHRMGSGSARSSQLRRWAPTPSKRWPTTSTALQAGPSRNASGIGEKGDDLRLSVEVPQVLSKSWVPSPIALQNTWGTPFRGVCLTGSQKEKTAHVCGGQPCKTTGAIQVASFP